MIHRAIVELNEGGGSSDKAISEFIEREYSVLPFVHDAFLRHHLMKLCERKEILCVKGGKYILPIGRGFKKRKRGRGKGKKMNTLSRVENKDGEEAEGGDNGEGIERQTEAQETRTEGNDERKKGQEEQKEVAEKVNEGKEENTEVVEEQSKLDRQLMEVTVVHIEVCGMSFLHCVLTCPHMLC